MRLKYIFCIFLFIQGVNVFATIQKPDYLIYNGTKYFLYENPMEEYFNRFPLRKPRSEWINTSLWRGYIATFEIINNELWVIDIEIEKGLIQIDKLWTPELISVKNKSFKRKDKIKADWFTGSLSFSQSRYSNENEYYIILEIENGNIVLEYDLSSEQYLKYIRVKSIIDSGLMVDYIKLNDELYKIYEETGDTADAEKYNELYYKYSEPLDYDKLINELNDGSMPNELIDYLIRYINNKNSAKTTLQNNIPLWKLIIIAAGSIILIGGIILFVINIGKLKKLVYNKRIK